MAAKAQRLNLLCGVRTSCAGKRGRRGRQGEEDEKNTTTNETSALGGRAAVVGGMVVVAASRRSVQYWRWCGRRYLAMLVEIGTGHGDHT